MFSDFSLSTTNLPFLFMSNIKWLGYYFLFFEMSIFMNFFHIMISKAQLFHTVHGVLKARILKWFAIPFMRNAGLDEAQAGIKIARRNINNFRYADDTTLIAEKEEELKTLLVKVKGESEKVGLKLSIQKTNIMASGPITSWQINGETVADFFWGAPKSLQMVTTAMKLKDTYSLEGKL